MKKESPIYEWVGCYLRMIAIHFGPDKKWAEEWLRHREMQGFKDYSIHMLQEVGKK